MIPVACKCGFRGQVPPHYAGKYVKCRKCPNMIAVSASAPPVARQPVGKREVIEPASPPEEDNPWGDIQGDAPPRISDGGIGVASNPGNVRVHFLHYIRCYPRGMIILSVLLLPVVALAGFLVLVMLRNGVDSGLKASPFLGVLCIPFAFVYLLFLSLYHARVVFHFEGGCICPAVVLSVNPYRIAVYTDLSMGGASRPAIKVLRQPLGKMTGGPPKVGQRLATISTYWPRTSRGYYGNFDPRVVNCATRDEDKIKRVFATIGEDEWRDLYAGLKQLDDNPRPGLYHIDPHRAPQRVAGAGDPQLALVGLMCLIGLVGCGILFGGPKYILGLSDRVQRERQERQAKAEQDAQARPAPQEPAREPEKIPIAKAPLPQEPAKEPTKEPAKEVAPRESPREVIFKEMMACMKDCAAILKTVNNERTAKEASLSMAKVRERWKDLVARNVKLGRPTAEELEPIKKKYDDQFNAIKKEMGDEGKRLAESRIPGTVELLEAIMEIFDPRRWEKEWGNEPLVQGPMPKGQPKEAAPPKPDPKPEVKPEQKPEPKPDPKPEMKPEPKPEPKPQPPPVLADLIAGVRKQVADQQLKKWNFIGGGFAKDPYEEVPAQGAILIGFRYSLKADGRPAVVQPIWQTAAGVVNGKSYGTAEKAETLETRAKPGYAVGAIYVRGGAYIAGFRPIYMRMTAQGLDTNDRYEAPHIGIETGGSTGTLGGDGNYIVGLHGKVKGALLGTLSPVTLTGPPQK